MYDHYPNRNRFYPDVGQKGFSDHMTLGFLGKTCRLKEQDPHVVSYPREREKIEVAKNDWRLCEAITKRSGCKIEDFEQIIQRITTSGIAQRRNQLAHGEPISQDDAQVLRTAIIGQKEKPGILIWLVENLEPKK